MTLRKLAVIVVVGVAALILVTSIVVYVLWSSGEDPPERDQPVTTVRQ